MTKKPDAASIIVPKQLWVEPSDGTEPISDVLGEKTSLGPGLKGPLLAGALFYAPGMYFELPNGVKYRVTHPGPWDKARCKVIRP